VEDFADAGALLGVRCQRRQRFQCGCGTDYEQTQKTEPAEKAHAGASASFDYQVTYATGEQKKVTFNSYYKPWQAVCLVGVAQLSVNGSTTTSTQSTFPLSPDQSTPVTP
jgi:hypothetical protein